MKIVCLKPINKARVLVDTDQEPDYKEKYLMEDGQSFDVQVEQPVESTETIQEPVKKVVKKPSKPKKK